MTVEPATGLPTRLPSLTGARAVAATGVFLHHFGQVRWYAPTGPLETCGPAGVSFFFVLSGFVLCWAVETSPPGQPQEPVARFWLRRVLRLWPLHLLLLAVFAVVEVAHLGLDRPGPLLLARHALLVQTWSLHWPGIIRFDWPAWSLAAEAFFSFVFPFALRWLPTGRQALHALLAALVTTALVVVPLCSLLVPEADIKRSLFLYELPLSRLPEFLIGIVLARLVARGGLPRLPRAPVAAACLVWTLVGAPLLPEDAARTYALVPSSVLLVLVLAQHDVAGRRGVFSSRPLLAFGAASYAFFLVHFLPLRVEPVADAVTHWSTPGLVALGAALFAAAWALAFPLHRFVEEPAARLGRRRAIRPRPVGPGGSVALP